MKLEFQILYLSSKATNTQAESSKLITGNATQMELESLTLKFLYIYVLNLFDLLYEMTKFSNKILLN